MRITTVSIGFTFNRGNYQSLRVDATAEVRDGESPAAVGEALLGYVMARGGAGGAALDHLDRATLLQGRWTPPEGFFKVAPATLAERVREDVAP